MKTVVYDALLTFSIHRISIGDETVSSEANNDLLLALVMEEEIPKCKSDLWLLSTIGIMAFIHTSIMPETAAAHRETPGDCTKHTNVAPSFAHKRRQSTQ